MKLPKGFIDNDVIQPLARRAGTYISGMALGVGATVEQANAIELIFVTVICLTVDLVLSKMNRGRK